ncbi:cytochrome c3 family protein [Vibrio sp. NTOU-M3]|uniref:cytochrome c3 family protein n=1 Tax=Vibrio sp. NTOU-M3 TaxID=3234954 RepID=UPI00349FC210
MHTWSVRAVCIVLFTTFSGCMFYAHAEETFSAQLSPSNTLEHIQKENKRCIRCHQKERLLKQISAIHSVGKHASSEYENNCTACHGDKEKHPKDDHTIIPQRDSLLFSAWEQNQRCVSCHSPILLRHSDWTHDVHAAKLTCSNCHQLHRSQDPIIGIQPRFRIGLCVTCHESMKQIKHYKQLKSEE